MKVTQEPPKPQDITVTMTEQEAINLYKDLKHNTNECYQATESLRLALKSILGPNNG